MDPLKNAQHIAAGCESHNAKRIKVLSEKCLAYDGFKKAMDLAEMYCGNEFDANPDQEAANLFTLQALILQRLGEISPLEDEEEDRTPDASTGSPPPVHGSEHGLPGCVAQQGPTSGGPVCRDYSSSYREASSLSAHGVAARATEARLHASSGHRSQSSSSNSFVGVVESPAFEAEGNPPAVSAEDLEVAFREGLQDAWDDHRWADFIALADQRRKMLGNPTIDPLYLRTTQLEQHVERLRKQAAEGQEALKTLAEFVTGVFEQTPDGGKRK